MRRLEQLAPLAGIVAVALWILSIVLIGTTDEPDDDAPVQAYVEHYDDDVATIVLSDFLFALGVLFFLLFVSALRQRLGGREDRQTLWTPLVYAAGIATAVSMLGIAAPDFAAAWTNNDISGEALQALNSLSDGFFTTTELASALFVIAVGLHALQSGVLPRWLAWVSLALGLLLLILPIGWAAFLFLLPLWVIAVGVLLARDAPPATTAP